MGRVSIHRNDPTEGWDTLVVSAYLAETLRKELSSRRARLKDTRQSKQVEQFEELLKGHGAVFIEGEIIGAARFAPSDELHSPTGEGVVARFPDRFVVQMPRRHLLDFAKNLRDRAQNKDRYTGETKGTLSDTAGILLEIADEIDD